MDFYPSISQYLLEIALDFASEFTPISDEERNIIIKAKNSILYANSKPWKKKNSNDFFDNTQGSFDGAEVCELIGLYLLPQIRDLGQNSGLYRDDGLMVSRLTARQNENLKKEICHVFQKNVLKVTIQANLKIVDFLDVTLNLENDTYKPLVKPNCQISYVNVGSNHPPSILQNIPKSINIRLKRLSKLRKSLKIQLALIKMP